MNNQIFRETALEKLSSPEQLDHMSAVVGIKTWMVLSACGWLIIAILVWSFTGSVTEKAEGAGILVPDKTGEIKALLFVSSKDAIKITQGMETHVFLPSEGKRKGGYINAKVIGTDSTPLTLSKLESLTGNMNFAELINSHSLNCSVYLELQKLDAETFKKNMNNYFFNGTVIIRKSRPIDFVMP